jgi:hypothetical protein
MWRIPNVGAGACGFISLRTGLELHHVLDKLAAGEKVDEFMIDGHDEEMLAAAMKMRTTVTGFYYNKLHAEIPEFGEYTVGGRPWRRIDLIALEMVKKGIDVPEDGPEREKEALRYLKAMSAPCAWMSTPEYTAVALIAKKKVVVYQGTREINCVNDVPGRPLNLYFRENHYEAIITQEERDTLEAAYGPEPFKDLKLVE